MAKKEEIGTPDTETPVVTDTIVETKARVLIDCEFGKVNTVVTVSAALIEKSPYLDSNPDAVAYAETIKA